MLVDRRRRLRSLRRSLGVYLSFFIDSAPAPTIVLLMTLAFVVVLRGDDRPDCPRGSAGSRPEDRPSALVRRARPSIRFGRLTRDAKGPMRILITNDDGIHAPGLEVLERIARGARPTTSGWWRRRPTRAACRIRCRSTTRFGSARSTTAKFALRGTPSDCVIMAVRRLLGGKPDLVLSGVNSGQNAADDVTYSGTIAGAFEGTLLGIPSIALSQAYTFEEGVRHIPWETAATHGARHHPQARRLRLPAGDRLQHQLPQPDARRGRRAW